MRTKTLLILFAAFLLCCFPAFCDESADGQIVAEDWSWEKGAYNTFDGSIDLRDLKGINLTIRIENDLVTEEETNPDIVPVFTVVNGKRITVRKQSDTVQFIPDDEQPIFTFSGSLMLPEKKRVRSVRLQITAADESGKVLKQFSFTVGAWNNETGQAAGSFYIPYDIRTITWILTAAAAAVWAVALIRTILHRKKPKRSV